LQDIVQPDPRTGARNEHVVEQVGCFIGSRAYIAPGAGEGKLDRFLAQLLEPQVLRRQQSRRVTFRRSGRAPFPDHARERRQRRAPGKAALRTGVTGGARRLDECEESVTVAVRVQRDEAHRVAAGRALVPQLSPAARPEPQLTRDQRLLERLAVREREHQDDNGSGVLHDDGDEAVARGVAEPVLIGRRSYLHVRQMLPVSMARMTRASAVFVAIALPPVWPG